MTARTDTWRHTDIALRALHLDDDGQIEHGSDCDDLADARRREDARCSAMRHMVRALGDRLTPELAKDTAPWVVARPVIGLCRQTRTTEQTNHGGPCGADERVVTVTTHEHLMEDRP